MTIQIISRWDSKNVFYQSESSATIREALLDAIASYADLGGADLRGADLRYANLGGADLRGANLGGADLRGADLGGADLRGADLRYANLGGADLGGADLRYANLGGADLGGADLRYADLRGADLRGANLGGADLGGADLRGANLRDADLVFRCPSADPRGYESYGCATSGTWVLHAGCHSFSAADAKEHWGSPAYPNSNRAKDYLKITVPYFEDAVRLRTEAIDGLVKGLQALA